MDNSLPNKVKENQEKVSSLHHSFDVELASLYGIDIAVLVHHFQFWINRNKNLKRNFHDGRTWTYETIEEIAAHFPYWSYKQTRNILDKLVKHQIIIKGNYNKHEYDRTCWYSFKNEKQYISIDKCPKGQMDYPKRADLYQILKQI